jgi:phosphate transport system permease protein
MTTTTIVPPSPPTPAGPPGADQAGLTDAGSPTGPGTPPPTAPPTWPDVDQTPRRGSKAAATDEVLTVCGSLAAALALAAVAFHWLLPWNGKAGFVLTAYAAFLGVYLALTGMRHPRPIVKDRLFASLVAGTAVILLSALTSVVVSTVVAGHKALIWHPNFFTKSMKGVGTNMPLDQGGISFAIIGTLIEVGIALAITIPLGLLTAVFMNEVPGRLSRFVRTITEAASALPSIIAGLFVYALLITPFGTHGVYGVFDCRGARSVGLLPRSGLAAALAITIMMLPIVTRAADVVIRLVPGALKEASYALGSGQWRTVWKVTLPTARSGLATAVILATARGIGETSPVLITAGWSATTTLNPVCGGNMASLPLAAFHYITSGSVTGNVPTDVVRGFGAAVVLLILVVILFALARLLGRGRK